MLRIDLDNDKELQEAIATVKSRGFRVIYAGKTRMVSGATDVPKLTLQRIPIKDRPNFAEHVTKDLARNVANFLLCNEVVKFTEHPMSENITYRAECHVIVPDGEVLDFPSLDLGAKRV
jgi:hypothetical protein